MTPSRQARSAGFRGWAGAGSFQARLAATFGLVFVAGGVATTLATREAVQSALVRFTEERALDLAEDLARELSPLVAAGDWAEVRSVVENENEHTAFVALRRPDGTLIGHCPAELRDELAGSLPLPRMLAGRRAGVGIAALPDGSLVAAGLSLAPATAATQEIAKRTLLVAIVLVVIGIALVLWLAAFLTAPIRVLRDVSERMGHGDLEARAPLGGGREIAQLAVALNESAARLRERIDQAERLRRYHEQILDGVPAGILVSDRDGGIRYANVAARTMFGDIAGRAWADVLGAEIDWAIVATAWTLEDPLRFCSTVPRARSYSVAVAALATERPEIVVALADQTEIRTLSQRLQSVQHLAAAGEIAAGIAHAVNNPLDGVTRALALARRSPGDVGRVTDMLDIAIEGTDRIAAVIRTMLDFARAEARQATVKIGPNELVREAASLATMRADRACVMMSLDLAPDLPQVLVEPRGIIEAILSLLINAVDACASGGEVVARTRAVSADLVEISVRDDGMGIRSEHLDHIFEPFFTTKAVGQGTGLGLAVAQRIIDAYGGEITVESTVGAGTTFRVRLPALARNGTES